MKKIYYIVLFCLALSSCRNDAKTDEVSVGETSKSYDQNDGLITLKGDFIYDEAQNAAVIQTTNQVYGVVIDDGMKDLNEKVKAYKKDATDMVPVTVRVKRIASTKENTWPFFLEIKETLKVEAPEENPKDVIKIEN